VTAFSEDSPTFQCSLVWLLISCVSHPTRNGRREVDLPEVYRCMRELDSHCPISVLHSAHVYHPSADCSGICLKLPPVMSDWEYHDSQLFRRNASVKIKRTRGQGAQVGSTILLYRLRSPIQYLVSLCQVWLLRTATGQSRKTSPKDRNDPSRENLVLSVSPVKVFSHDSGAFLGRMIFEPSQNSCVRIELIGALARASHLGATVTIQELPLRRA
jgi:hypothetical protein